MDETQPPGTQLGSSASSSGDHPDLGEGFARVIVELAPDGIIVSDDDGRILMANRQVEDLFGYGRDALVGAQVETLLPPRLRHAHVTHRSDYVTAPATRPMGAGLELFGCHADGSEFPIEISLSPVANGHGRATIVVIRDVTDQRALERAVRETCALDENERIGADLNDRVIGHIFGSALTLASVVGRNDLDDKIAERLHEVIDELDEAVREIRSTVFARLGHKSDPRPRT